MTVIKTTSTINMKIELKAETFNHHFRWFPESNHLSVLYYDCFKNQAEFDESFFRKIQDVFLYNIHSKLSKKINKCYIFLAIHNNGTKVENYYKVWKQIGRHFNIDGLIPVEEKIFDKYYIGLACFKEANLKTALAIQNRYYNNSFILIDVNIQENNLNVQELASLFLAGENDGFKKLISKYSEKGIFLIRIGDDGDEWEVDLIYS